MNGRANDIESTEYDGHRPANLAFDPADLYCYLRAAATQDAGIDTVITLFEQEFHVLPPIAEQEIRMEYITPTIEELETATDGDSEVQLLRDPVEILVSNYVSHYTNRNRIPPLGRDTDVITASAERTSTHGSRRGQPTTETRKSVNRRQMSTAAETPSDALTTPLLSEVAMAGYRTGNAVRRLAASAWERLTTPADSTDPYEASDKTGNRDE